MIGDGNDPAPSFVKTPEGYDIVLECVNYVPQPRTKGTSKYKIVLPNGLDFYQLIVRPEKINLMFDGKSYVIPVHKNMQIQQHGPLPSINILRPKEKTNW